MDTDKNKNKNRKWKFIANVLTMILLWSVLYYPDGAHNMVQGIKDRIEVNRVNRLEIININHQSAMYNQGNWQNWNAATEDETHIYYTGNGVNIERKNKLTEEKEVILESQDGTHLSNFMLFDDYIIVRRGKEIMRIKKDGSTIDIIYKSNYPIDMMAYKNRLYFFLYDKGIYTVDVNGRELKCINPQPVQDMTIDDEIIYYSFITDGEGYVKSMNLDGSNKKDLFKANATNLVVRGADIYYVDDQTNQLFYFDGESKMLVSEQKINQFNIAEDGIYGLDIHSGYNVDFKEEYFTLYFIGFDKDGFDEPVVVDQGRSVWGFTILEKELYYKAAKGFSSEQLVTRKR